MKNTKDETGQLDTLATNHTRMLPGHTSLLVLMEIIFTPLVSVLFMECQLHIMKIDFFFLEHMSHMHANFRYKHTSIRTHINMAIQIWQFLIDYTAMHNSMCSACIFKRS